MSLDPSLLSNEHHFAPYWGIHSEKAGQPMLRDWAKSESDANEKMRAIQQNDDDADTTYWVIQMTEAEAESFKLAGVIPTDG